MPVAQPFRNQRYAEIKKDLKRKGGIFVDAEFPPDKTSLFHGIPPTKGTIEWLRPGEIVQNPRFIVDGLDTDDVMQGCLGNCWFVSACSALTHHKELWTKVIPDAEEQEWNPKDPKSYCGIFHFSFWRGDWIDVVIDDLLPVQNGKLIFARSKTVNEFWSALLEKAFAKLHGCYGALSGGSLAEALVDITGGVPEMLDLSEEKFIANSNLRDQVYYDLRTAYKHKTLMAAAIAAKSPEEMEQPLSCGLVKGHSYAVTKLATVSIDGTGSRSRRRFWLRFNSNHEKVNLIRLRNPWGDTEWTGAWADGSSEWDLISQQQQKTLGLKVQEDGEFWMSWSDFEQNFTDISICYLFNTKSFLKPRFRETRFRGMWHGSEGQDPQVVRAGGCIDCKQTFFQNPQYCFSVKSEQVSQPIIIHLMQRDIRERRRTGSSFLTIGIQVLKVEENRKYRCHHLHESLKAIRRSEYVDTRSVSLRLTDLPKGCYVVVPSTYAAYEEGEFFLRIFAAPAIEPFELLLDSPADSICSFFRTRPLYFTRIFVISATGLEAGRDSSDAPLNPYCLVHCEGRSFKSMFAVRQSVADATIYLFDFGLFLVRRNIQRPIVIHISGINMRLKRIDKNEKDQSPDLRQQKYWAVPCVFICGPKQMYSANCLKDTFLGSVELLCPLHCDLNQERLILSRKTKDPTNSICGQLLIDAATTEDPMLF